MTRWFSLRRRLFLLLLGGVLGIWTITAVFSYRDAHHEVDELFDAQLAQAGQTLLALATHEEAEGVNDMSEVAHRYQRRLRFQVWLADGTLMLRSWNAPAIPMTGVEGFSESIEEQGTWRHFAVWNEERSMQVQVSEDHRIRDDLVQQIARRLLWPALIGLPIVAVWVWLAIRYGLRALDALTDEVAARAPGQLQPVQPQRAPEEVRPLLLALNGLFARMEATLASERRFTADAAHELRTPLAALYAQAQVAVRARDEGERERSFGELQAGLMRAAHLVDQMLHLARLDPQSALPSAQPVDLVPLAQSVCAELGVGILDRHTDFVLEAESSGLVSGQPEWLRVLIRNLVDNAIRYTPPGGSVSVHIGRVDERIVLAVDDSGPGIPPAQREAVLRRFHRLDPSEQAGCGLGLAIVARIAELHAASLVLGESAAQGLRVTVSFPALMP